MTTTKPFWRRARLPLAISLASTLSAPAFALNFNIGEIEAQFDSSLSVGASWATSKPNQDLIGANNGGRGLSQTSDDSHLNFKRGETFSKIFKGVHDLELRYGDMGAFLRGKYWYDFELKDESRLFKDIDDHNRKEGAQASGAQLLDAFAYYNYNLADQRLRWVRQATIARRAGLTEPTWAEFLQAWERRPGIEKLNTWREMAGGRLYREAGDSRLNGATRRAAVKFAAAAALRPVYAMTRLKSQLARG